MPKIVDHEQYREELVWACYRVFADLGYARCTMKELARAAGVTPGTLYHYFPDKLQLFQSVVRTIAETDLGEWDRVIQRAEGPAARLAELGQYIDRNEVYFSRQYRLWRDVAAHLDSGDAFSAELRELYARFLKQLESIFEGMDASEVSSRCLVITLASILDGLTFHRQVEPTHPNFSEVFAAFGALIQAQRGSLS